MISFGKATSSHSGLIPLKTSYTERGEIPAGDRELEESCIQLLLLQFLHVIWSMPTNFALFEKLLGKFFYTLDNP